MIYATQELLWTNLVEELSIEQTVTALGGMLISRVNNARKEVFQTPVRKLALAYRRTVLQIVLQMARANEYPPVASSKKVDVEKKPLLPGKFQREPFTLHRHVQAAWDHEENRPTNNDAYHRRVAI